MEMQLCLQGEYNGAWVVKDFDRLGFAAVP